MSYTFSVVLLVVVLFGGMLSLLTIGQRLGRQNLPQETDAARARLTAVEAAIFGLLGLLIAFTFFGASGRYELRRQLVVDEANAIGKAYLRLDLLPASAQPALREKFRRYLEARIAVYRVLPDVDASMRQAAVAASLQKEIWAGAIAALREAPSQVTIVLIPALNEMFDVTTSRATAALTHTPAMIVGLLVALALVCSLLAGYVMAASKPRNVILHSFAFALVLTVTVYVIFDLDYPRFGLIQLDFADQPLFDLLAGMK